MDSREPRTADHSVPGPAWPKPAAADERVAFAASQHQIDRIEADKGSVAVKCSCGWYYDRDEFSDHVATMVGRVIAPKCTCFGDESGFSLCAWHESLFASAKAEAARAASEQVAAPSPAAREPIDVERLSTAILNTLYPNWPKKGGYPHEPWHDDAVQIAAEYARLSDNP